MRRRPDHRRIHELEYELGIRDDPPPAAPLSDAPGAILYFDAVMKEVWPDEVILRSADAIRSSREET